jgi:hypothetical protein
VPDETKVKLAGAIPAGSEIPQFHLPAPTLKPGGKLTYTPYLYGSAGIQFADKRRGVDEERKTAFLLPLDPQAKTIDWDQAKPTSVTQEQLVTRPAGDAQYLPLPPGATQIKVFTRWAKQFDRWLARTQRVVLQTVQAKGETAGEADQVEIRPKRGGVTVYLVAIVWEPKAE